MDLSNEYKNIFNNIDGFLLIDANERIVFMADNLLKQLNVSKMDQVVGKSIRDVIPTNKAYKILETGKKRIGEMYFIEGYTIVSNGYPIYKNGKLVGAFEYDVFANIGFLEGFLEQIDNVGKTSVPSIKRKNNSNTKAKYSIDDIKGSSKVIKKLKEEIIAASQSSSTVLITGETGSGKELVANAIHKLSQRSLFHFVSLNCAAIPAELFESELFGYDEGSFTGARKGGKYGKVEIANNGTLFLDEIDNLSLGMQAKILRFLQEKEIYHVGGEYAIPVNTRVIAATNQDVKKLVDNKKMRSDLYYRLNVIEIKVPPLRDRLEDIPEIMERIVFNLSNTVERGFRPIMKIDERIYKILKNHDWPGNIRELSNVIERAVNKCSGNELKYEHFKDFDRSILSKSTENPYYGKTLKEIKDATEKEAIKAILLSNNGNITKTAKDLGITRQMLHRKIK